MKSCFARGLAAIVLLVGSSAAVGGSVGELPSSQNATIEERVNRAIDGLINRDTGLFEQTLDLERLIEHIFDGLDTTGGAKKGFRNGFLAKKSELVNNLAQAFAEAQSVTHLRTVSKVGHVSLLYRLEFGPDGITFLEFSYDPTTSRITDWYDYGAGRTASEGVRIFAMGVLGPQSIGEFVSSVFDDSRDHRKRLLDMASALQRVDYAAMIELYRSGSDDFRGSETALEFLMIAATNSGLESEYEYSLSQVAEFGGDDPRYSFVLLDHYFLRGEYDKTIAAVELIQDRMGLIEASFEELKAAIYTTAGDAESALTHMELAASVEPDRDAAYAGLFELYAYAGRYADAHRMLELLNERFDYGLEPEQFASDTELLPYVEWVRAQAAE